MGNSSCRPLSAGQSDTGPSATGAHFPSPHVRPGATNLRRCPGRARYARRLRSPWTAPSVRGLCQRTVNLRGRPPPRSRPRSSSRASSEGEGVLHGNLEVAANALHRCSVPVARTGRDHHGTAQRDRLTSKVLRPPPARGERLPSGHGRSTHPSYPQTLLRRPDPDDVTCPCFYPAPFPNQPGKPASGTTGDEERHAPLCNGPPTSWIWDTIDPAHLN